MVSEQKAGIRCSASYPPITTKYETARFTITATSEQNPTPGTEYISDQAIRSLKEMKFGITTASESKSTSRRTSVPTTSFVATESTTTRRIAFPDPPVDVREPELISGPMTATCSNPTRFTTT